MALLELSRASIQYLTLMLKLLEEYKLFAREMPSVNTLYIYRLSQTTTSKGPSNKIKGSESGTIALYHIFPSL